LNFLVFLARWSEDGLWYKAKITDLLPETQSYLVVFVEYGNSQACTAVDLAPLDMPVTAAAPPPLQDETDPVVVEQQRLARIAERQQQLRAEEEARKAVLEEKRKQVAERKARAEALEKAEQMQRIEEQRLKLESIQQRQAVAALAQAPLVPGARQVGPKVEPASPAPQKEPVFAVPAPKTPHVDNVKQQQHSAPATPQSRTPLDQKALDKRLTLSVAGGSGAKLGLITGVITMQELKQVALMSPRGETNTPKKDPLDMTLSEAKAARALDFGDTPKKEAAKPVVVQDQEPKTPAKVSFVDAAKPAAASAAVAQDLDPKTPAKVSFVDPKTPVAAAVTPMKPVNANPTPVKFIQQSKPVDDDDELDEEEEDSDEAALRKPKIKQRGSMTRPTRPIPPPNVATAIGAPSSLPASTSAVSTPVKPAVVNATPVVVASSVDAKKRLDDPPPPKLVVEERRSVKQPLPSVMMDEGTDSIIAREALREFSVAAKSGEDTVTTTQILNDLEDSLESDLAELDDLRAEANDVDASISLFHQLREETNRLERTATAFADDLGDLEEEARLLLGE
jgi:hypothetical protein